MKLGVDPVTGSSVVQVLVNCGTISPEVRFQFNDSVIVERETYLTQTIPVETKDNYKLTLKTHLYCWFEITVSVTTRDLPPQVDKYNLHFRQLHADPQKGFLEEEMQRRSQTTFEGMDDELRTQMLYASEITTLMKKLGMAYEVDQPLPEKLALVWFENEFVPDFVSPDHLPEGHDAIGVSDEKVGTLRAKTPGGKKSKKQKS
ncbi:MAG: hypothetical protein P8X54_10635 [Desulfuromonadales bacterium]